MSDPFKIEGPALISFSGGRTSGYMLHRILQAHGGTLPDDVHVTFANTGKEMPQTLDFVRDCGERWGVEIIWLEYRSHAEKQKRFRCVTHAEASREGEPFTALLRDKQFLPSPPMRFCTSDLKIFPMKHMALTLGWAEWDVVLGLRADEQHRVAKSRVRSDRETWTNVMPLASAGVTKETVQAFWRAQNFDLTLPNFRGKTHHGNCDFCFLKNTAVLQRLMREMPERAQWWIDAENNPDYAKNGRKFRFDRPDYAALLQGVRDQREFDYGAQDELIDCFCGDAA